MNKKILGDFQTPLHLAKQIVSRLNDDGFHWARVLEPTCGMGNFIQAIIEAELPVEAIIGIEIQANYVQQALRLITLSDTRIQILNQDIFASDLRQWHTQDPLLILGNPPWITNSEQGAKNGDNLPTKSNFKQLAGLDALTGKSNFDVAEYIWIKLLHDFKHTDTTIALLCKTSVARNVLRYCHDAHIGIRDARMYRIDSQKWFAASVDACLFVLSLTDEHPDYAIDVFANLSAQSPESQIGFVDKTLVANIDTYHATRLIAGRSPIEWRQGIKHDAAMVMELHRKDNRWCNKAGESVDVEDAYIYPLLKSSDLQAHKSSLPTRGVIVTQQYIGEDTHRLQESAPRLWRYLNHHAEILDARKSSIYTNKPRFSIFGVGDYTFAQHKVVVSGFYKQALFVPVMPVDGKPVLCDDTCYLLPCKSALEAIVLAAALNHTLTQRFIRSIIFTDAKRPITKTLLSSINLEALIEHIPLNELQDCIDSLPLIIGTHSTTIRVGEDHTQLLNDLFAVEKRLL